MKNKSIEQKLAEALAKNVEITAKNKQLRGVVAEDNRTKKALRSEIHDFKKWNHPFNFQKREYSVLKKAHSLKLKKATIARKEGTYKISGTRQEKFSGINMGQNNKLLKNLLAQERKYKVEPNTRLHNAYQDHLNYLGDKTNNELKVKAQDSIKALGEKGPNGENRVLDVNKYSGVVKFAVNKKYKYSDNEVGDISMAEYEQLLLSDADIKANLENTIMRYGVNFLNPAYAEWTVRIMKDLNVVGTVDEFVEIVKKYT